MNNEIRKSVIKTCENRGEGRREDRRIAGRSRGRRIR